MIRSLVANTNCSVYGTASYAANPFTNLINRFFNNNVPIAARNHILNDLNSSEITAMQNAVNSGMELSGMGLSGMGLSGINFLNRYKTDKTFNNIWTQCESNVQLRQQNTEDLSKEFNLI